MLDLILKGEIYPDIYAWKLYCIEPTNDMAVGRRGYKKILKPNDKEVPY